MRKIYGKYHRICLFFPTFQNPLYCIFIELTYRWIFTKFIINIGRTLSGITKNPKSTSFIFQALSIVVHLNSNSKKGKDSLVFWSFWIATTRKVKTNRFCSIWFIVTGWCNERNGNHSPQLFSLKWKSSGL